MIRLYSKMKLSYTKLNRNDEHSSSKFQSVDSNYLSSERLEPNCDSELHEQPIRNNSSMWKSLKCIGGKGFLVKPFGSSKVQYYDVESQERVIDSMFESCNHNMTTSPCSKMEYSVNEATVRSEELSSNSFEGGITTDEGSEDGGEIFNHVSEECSFDNCIHLDSEYVESEDESSEEKLSTIDEYFHEECPDSGTHSASSSSINPSSTLNKETLRFYSIPDDNFEEDNNARVLSGETNNIDTVPCVITTIPSKYTQQIQALNVEHHTFMAQYLSQQNKEERSIVVFRGDEHHCDIEDEKHHLVFVTSSINRGKPLKRKLDQLHRIYYKKQKER